MPEKRDAISERYRNEAAELARRYTDILSERQQLEDAMEGRIIYTEEMAIADLLGSGQQEGERVQTSNISNIPEKIAILLADGYVEKQINRMRKEALRRIDDYMDLCLKVNAVEVAMGERMTEREALVFRQIFIEHKSQSHVTGESGRKLDKKSVHRSKITALQKVADELYFQDYIRGEITA